MNKKNLRSLLIIGALFLFSSQPVQAFSGYQTWNNSNSGIFYDTTTGTQWFTKSISDFQPNGIEATKPAYLGVFDIRNNGIRSDSSNEITDLRTQKGGDLNAFAPQSQKTGTSSPFTESRTMILFGFSLITVGGYIRKISNKQH